MKIVKKLFKSIIFLTILGFVIIFILYLVGYFMPKIDLNTNHSYYIYDNKDNLIYQGNNKKEWVSLDEIDNKLISYIINVEDQHFYSHKGFDIPRIIKSFINNIKSNKIVAGASSISQQYVKNLYLDFEQTWKRKIEEAFLTIRLETHYTKKEILEGYLNTIYFGNGIYGVKDAANYYFNKDVNNLTEVEAIILAGIPKSPNNYNPISNYESCKKRVKTISNLLLENKVISKDIYNNLNIDNVILYGKKDNNDLNTYMYYHEAVIQELKSIPNAQNYLNDGNVKIFTTLDYDLQKITEDKIKEIKEEDTQIANLIINPNTGAVLTLIGGKNYYQSNYNRVLKSKRQVGSTIKPFLYYTALENGMTSSSNFKSEQTVFTFANNKTYSPSNYGNLYGNKNISMNAALAYSDNIFAVKTHLFLGEDKLVNTMKLTGLREDLPNNPSLALGAYDINMLDYARSYITLSSGGYTIEPYFIEKILDKNGNLLYQHKEEKKQVLNENYLYILNEMMTSTYNYNFKDYTNPTVIYLSGKLKQKYAIKSGTTDNDYWLVGYNKNILNIIWAGNDHNENVNHKYSTIIKDIWYNSCSYYYDNNYFDDYWYTLPSNVVAIPMDPVSGKYDIKSKTLFYFVKGSELPYIQ